MRKYKFQAYNDSPYGPTHEIVLTVVAQDEPEALKIAQNLAQRENYMLIEIELIREFNKRG